MTYEEIEREAANLIKKFPEWHPDDRQAFIQQILIETLKKGHEMGVDQAMNWAANWYQKEPNHPKFDILG